MKNLNPSLTGRSKVLAAVEHERAREQVLVMRARSSRRRRFVQSLAILADFHRDDIMSAGIVLGSAAIALVLFHVLLWAGVVTGTAWLASLAVCLTLAGWGMWMDRASKKGE